MEKIKLNLGCGQDIRPGFVNVDLIKHPKIKNIDLNHYPLPFKTNSVDYILSSHLLEYLDNPVKFMLELQRICKKDAVIDLIVPHFSLGFSYAELGHKRPGISYQTFGNKHWNKILFDRFDVISKKLNFTRENFTFLNYFFNPLINLSPVFYERFLCYIIPCSEVHFKLKVIK